MQIEVVRGDITRTEVEAIVNAANNQFWMGSGVAGAIKAAGGEIIEREAVAKGPAFPGDSIHTTAGDLPYKVIIHAAVMGQDLRTSARLIRQATVSSLKLADELGIKSVALPAFGTGVGNFPMKACANLMVASAGGFQQMAKQLELVQFCLFDEFGYVLFQESLEKALNRGTAF
ncbi:MAG: macro domain-containing protein [bacterium]|nr:macro domain-containing protein [bacterium]